MSNNSELPAFSPEDNARDAAKWRELCAKVKYCVNESPSGYASIWGGDDNLHAEVNYQYKGTSGMVLTLHWVANNEVRDDFDLAVQPDAPEEE